MWIRAGHMDGDTAAMRRFTQQEVQNEDEHEEEEVVDTYEDEEVEEAYIQHDEEHGMANRSRSRPNRYMHMRTNVGS